MALRLAETIAGQIRDGLHRPGDNLREIPLAEAFGVSRSSIREAFRILERDGVVRIEPRRGASVTRLTTDELIEIFQVRAVLLALAFGRFAATASDADVDWVTDRIEALQATADAPPADAGRQHAELSTEICRYMIERVGNGLLTGLLTRMSLQIARYTLLGLGSPERRRQSRQSWAALLTAIRARDIDAVERQGRQQVSENLAAALTRLAGA